MSDYEREHEDQDAGWTSPEVEGHDLSRQPPGVAPLLDVVELALQLRGWRYEQLRDDVIRLRVCGSAADYEIYLSAMQPIGVVRCFVVMPVRISAAFQTPAVDLINRFNHELLLIGNVEMQPDDGTPRWRVSLDVEGGDLVPRMVNNMLDAGISACDRFWPALMAVGVLGSAPESAMRLLTQG